MPATRNARRDGMAVDHRIRLLEGDADDLESAIDRLGDTLGARVNRVAESVDSVRKVLVGMLVSLATATALFALNLLLGFGGTGG